MYKTYSMYEKSAETIKQLVPTKEEASKLATKLDDILKGKAAAGDASFVRANRAFAQMGHNTESAFNNAFSQMEGVNKHLGASNLMENVSIGASAAGSAMAGRSDSK